MSEALLTVLYVKCQLLTDKMKTRVVVVIVWQKEMQYQSCTSFC
jgi:hypothetical protein